MRFSSLIYKSILFTIIFLFSFNLYSEKKNILVIHSYHQGLEWTDAISSGIDSVFNQTDNEYEVYFEYLDTKRNPGEEYFKRVSEFESHKTQLAGISFDVVITSDNDALRFIVESGDDLFPKAPIVFCGVNNFAPSMLKGKTNITGVKEIIDYDSTISIMKKLHPEKSKILFVLDRTSTGIAIKHEVDKIIERYKDTFDFEFYREIIPGSVENKIKALRDEYLIYILSYNSNKNGVFISYKDAIETIYKHSDVPIYGSWDFFFGKGIIGGMITSGYSQGEQAALFAKRILAGEDADEIAISDSSTNAYMFDYRELDRFTIDLDQLPAGSIIANPPKTFYEQYGFLLLPVILFFIFVLISYLIQKLRKDNLTRQNEVLDRKVKSQTTVLVENNLQLKKEITEREKVEKILTEKNLMLEEALEEVNVLSGLLPICSGCKKIRDDKGYWNQIDSYFSRHSDIDFSHSLCPDCAHELYPKYYREKKK